MKISNLCFLFFAILAISLSSCRDDDDGGDPMTGTLMLTSLDATGVSFEDGSAIESDLNGAVSAEDVSLNPAITATFNKEVDASTANTSNITLTDANGNEVPLDVSASGSTVTINPTAELSRGTLHTLSIGGGLTAMDGGTFTAATRSFTTEGRAPVVVPNAGNQIAYWTFNGLADDETGDYPADNVVAVTYGEDRFGQANSAADFDGDESIIEVLNGSRLLADDDLTIAFWMKTNSEDHVNENGDPASHFVFGLGAFFGLQFEVGSNYDFCKFAQSYIVNDTLSVSEDAFFNGNGEDANNGGWQGWDFVADLSGRGGVEAFLKDRWVHVVASYDASEKTHRIYFDGELMKSHDFNLWPDGAPKRDIQGVTYRGMPTDVEDIFAIGFVKSIDSPLWADTPWGDYAKPTANHFKGQLDDLRVFDTAYSQSDVTDLYNAEAP